MATYKLVDADNLDYGLTQIANKIREKGGATGLLEFYQEFVDAIDNIEGGGGGGGDDDGLYITKALKIIGKEPDEDADEDWVTTHCYRILNEVLEVVNE